MGVISETNKEDEELPKCWLSLNARAHGWKEQPDGVVKGCGDSNVPAAERSELFVREERRPVQVIPPGNTAALEGDVF